MIINIIAISTLATIDLCNSCANNVLFLSPQWKKKPVEHSSLLSQGGKI